MPIYEYKCTNCGEKFEMYRSLNGSDKEIKCPKCGKDSPKRLFSPFGMNSPWGTGCASGFGGGFT